MLYSLLLVKNKPFKWSEHQNFFLLFATCLIFCGLFAHRKSTFFQHLINVFNWPNHRSYHFVVFCIVLLL